MDMLVEMDSNKEGFGDLVFVNGKCPITVDDLSSTSQRVFVMLRTFEGEWFLNITTGVPYFQNILGKKIGKGGIDRIIQQKILSEPGVVEILSFNSSIDNKRTYSATFKARASSGDEFEQVFSFGNIAV